MGDGDRRVRSCVRVVFSWGKESEEGRRRGGGEAAVRSSGKRRRGEPLWVRVRMEEAFTISSVSS